MPGPLSRNQGIAVGLALAGYALMAYDVQRVQSTYLLSLYAGLFSIYLYLSSQRNSLTIKQIIVIGMLFRLIFLGALPSLSDDFYRFIWDGRLWFYGINPFAELPVYYMGHPGLAPTGLTPQLFNLLNSPTHYTVYPPIPQFINWVAAWLSPDSLWLSGVIMRVFQLLAELGTLLLFPRVLRQFKLADANMVWYAFNPLLIIELTGSLHHEALMIFFLMLFLVHFNSEKYHLAAFGLAMAVAAKLIPLMFLPYILLVTPKHKRLLFTIVFSGSVLVSFAPLLDASFFKGIENSLLLYYQKFEFNAGIYYAFRQLGYWVKGYNMIALIGKWMAGVTVLGVLAISYHGYRNNKPMPEVLLFMATLFALFSLILHPWYISLVILFGSMSRYRFWVVWSLLIMGTYAGYTAQGFSEVMPVVAFEFIVVLAMLLYELFWQDKPQLQKETNE